LLKKIGSLTPQIYKVSAIISNVAYRYYSILYIIYVKFWELAFSYVGKMTRKNDFHHHNKTLKVISQNLTLKVLALTMKYVSLFWKIRKLKLADGQDFIIDWFASNYCIAKNSCCKFYILIFNQKILHRLLKFCHFSDIWLYLLRTIYVLIKSATK